VPECSLHLAPFDEGKVREDLDFSWFLTVKSTIITPNVVGITLAMSKHKTHKSTKKRFRLTATGKAKHRKAGTSHLAISKSGNTIRKLRGTKVLETQFTGYIVEALRGYSY
jgi:large subunit ribosomal protein L35